MGRKDKQPTTADQKAQHARNCELVNLAIKAGDATAATNYIRITQGDKAARLAFLDEINRRR